MTRAVVLALTCAALIGGCTSPAALKADPRAPVLTRTLRLEGVRGTRPNVGVPGRFDHFAYDSATGRLFATALENGSLEVIDVESWSRVKSITGLQQPQGAAVVPAGEGASLVAVACGGDGVLRVYDTRTLEEKRAIAVGVDADNVRYDARLKQVYVTWGSVKHGAIAVFDATTWAKLREIPFLSRPESFQLDPAGSRLYANQPGGTRATCDGRVVVLDRDTNRPTTDIMLENLSRNFPMALDAAGERLFVVTRRPARLLCIDTRRCVVTGRVVCGEDSDDLFYDAKTGHVLVVCGGYRPDMVDGGPKAADMDETGSVEVYAVSSDGHMSLRAKTRTAPRARTGLFVPERRALYVAVPMRGEADPEVREYKVPE